MYDFKNNNTNDLKEQYLCLVKSVPGSQYLIYTGFGTTDYCFIHVFIISGLFFSMFRAEVFFCCPYY